MKYWYFAPSFYPSGDVDLPVFSRSFHFNGHHIKKYCDAGIGGFHLYNCDCGNCQWVFHSEWIL